jgi:hypothetical protein
MKRYYIAAFLLLLLTCLAPGLFAQGCSQCRMIPASDMQNGTGLARNLNDGILYLMAVPYIALTVVVIIYRKKLGGFFKKLMVRG